MKIKNAKISRIGEVEEKMDRNGMSYKLLTITLYWTDNAGTPQQYDNFVFLSLFGVSADNFLNKGFAVGDMADVELSFRTRQSGNGWISNLIDLVSITKASAF